MPSPKKPAYLRDLQGNPGRRAPVANEMKGTPRKRAPKPPESLKGDALEEWQRLAPELTKLGALTNLDLAAFEAYCWAFGRFRDAQRKLEEYGDVILTPNGMIQQSPYVSMATRALEAMNRYLGQFGLSPSARTRISIDAARDPKPLDMNSPDDVKRFLFGS